MMPQYWWELFPEVAPSPAARPRPLPGAGGVMPGPAMDPRPTSLYDAYDPDQAPPSAFDPAYFSAGELGADNIPGGHVDQVTPSFDGQPPFGEDEAQPAMDRNAAIQHAASAIQRGADPNTVRARLIQMGHGDQEPLSPFSDLIPKGRPGMTGDSTPPPVQAQPAFDYHGGLEPRAIGANYAQEHLDELPQRLDPRLAPQKPGDLQKYSRQNGSTRDPGSATMFTYGLPSFPSDDQSRRRNLPRDPAGERRPSAASNLARGDPKSYPPRSRPDVHVTFSSPRTGGPRNPVPRRSYSVRRDSSGGGLNGYGYVPQQGDAQLLARAIYAESGITPEDMPAIGWSIINRVGFRQGQSVPFGPTLSHVIFQRAGRSYQYSFLNDGGTREWHDTADPSRIPASGRRNWARAVAIANAILSGRAPDPSGGAHYFFSSTDYIPGNPETARYGFPSMLRDYHITPTPYQSQSTFRDRGRLVRNYFFRENPIKLWAPDPPRGRRR